MIKKTLNIFIIIFIGLSLKGTMSYDQNGEPNKFYIRWPEWMKNNNFSELSIEELVNKSTNEICKEMVSRRSLELSIPNSTNNYDYMNNSTILLNFPSYLTKVIDENGFLNQHQTSTGLGNNSQEQARDILEQGLYKTRFPNLFNADDFLVKKINQIRPKSSFIQFNDVKNHLSESRSYGDIFAVFTSSDIKERTVFTPRDSLGLRSDMEKDIDSVKVTPLTVTGLPKPNNNKLYLYREALICGEVTMKQADYFLVGCKLPYYFDNDNHDINHKKDFIETLDYLLSKNYQVFNCKINNEIEGYEKGDEITKENILNNKNLNDYLHKIKTKVDNIIKPKIEETQKIINRITKNLEEDTKEQNDNQNDHDDETKKYYENKIKKLTEELTMQQEKLINLLKQDEENKKDLQTTINKPLKKQGLLFFY
jgi:hypothetical protein